MFYAVYCYHSWSLSFCFCSCFVFASIYTLSLCRGHSWRVRLAKQETLTSPGHLVSPLVSRGPSVNVHRGALLLVPHWEFISSFVFYIKGAATAGAVTGAVVLLVVIGVGVAVFIYKRRYFIYITFVLLICLSVCGCVFQWSKYYLGHNLWTIRDKGFIYAMHTQQIKPFQITPGSMTLWHWPWLLY